MNSDKLPNDLILPFEPITRGLLNSYRKLHKQRSYVLGMPVKRAVPKNCSVCKAKADNQYNVVHIGLCCFDCAAKFALAGLINLVDVLSDRFKKIPHNWESDFFKVNVVEPAFDEDLCGLCGVMYKDHIKV